MRLAPNAAAAAASAVAMVCHGVCLSACVYTQVVGLYKKLGFVDDPQGIRGMAFQRKKKEKKGLF
jgi:hypothetical protein